MLLFDITQSEGKTLSFQASGQMIHFHVKLFCSIFKLMTHTYFQIVIFIIFWCLRMFFDAKKGHKNHIFLLISSKSHLTLGMVFYNGIHWS